MSGDDHSEQLNLLQTITLEVAAATDLSSALEIVLRRVCEKTGWVIGQAWVPNKEEAVLNFVSGWYCDDGELKPFKAVSEKSHFEPGIGPEVEHDAQIEGGAGADFDRTGFPAGKQQETVTGFQIGGRIHQDILRDSARIPISRYCTVRVHGTACVRRDREGCCSVKWVGW